MGFGGNFSDLKDLISCGQKLVAVEPSYWVVKHETAIRGLPKKPPYSNNLFRTINIFSKFSDVDVDEAISIGILVVNNDQACRNKVAEVLRRCNYQVLHTGTVYDALHAIWENKERLDIVVTNAQKLEREGLAIIQNIKQKLKTNVLLIGGDERVGLKGELFSFSAYRLNGLSVNGFNSLLGNARRMEEEKMVSNAAVETNMASSSINDKEHVNKNRKGVELYEERSEDSREDHRRSKKSRVTWTNEMHQRFLDAIERLGYDKAVPKKIVEVMGVPGLTRENVASHLQKYRCSMRRTQETVFGPFSCRSTRIDLEGFASLTSPTLENNLQSTSTSKDFAFRSLPERKFYSRIGGSHLMDKMRNMDQCQDKSSSSRKFVGYRFEGNKIDFGPERKMNRDALFSATSHVQHNPLLDSQFAEGPFQRHQQVSRTHGTEPDLLSSYAPKFEDQNPFQQPQVSVQQLGDCSDQNTLLQSWDMPETANAAPFDNQPENASTPSSMVPPSHQGFPVAGATGIDLTGRSPAAFVDDVLRAPSPPLPQMLQNLDEIFSQRGNDDDSVMNGMGNSYEQFDFPELDDTLFRQDN